MTVADETWQTPEAPAAGAGSGRLFPFARWGERLPELARRYQEAEPFPHIHLEGFLGEAVARRMAAEFPRPADTTWIQYKHYNERKLGKTERAEFPPEIGRVVDELNSPELVAWLSELTGIDGLLPDPSLEGGGLHQTEHGGFLNIHSDFTMHHHHHDWRRRVNLILFLNEGWREEWGGAIELWERDMSRCAVKVAPRLDHVVIFSTTEDSFHGYADPIACPPETTRKSLALYYYTVETEPHAPPRSTNYRARPGDGARAALIWLDKQVLALYSKVKSRLGLSDDFASRLLGLLSRNKER